MAFGWGPTYLPVPEPLWDLLESYRVQPRKAIHMLLRHGSPCPLGSTPDHLFPGLPSLYVPCPPVPFFFPSLSLSLEIWAGGRRHHLGFLLCLS